ncbi:3-oxo-Delta(4,5)-steroid 5-beta-reductase [Selaginella moellendorffii]|uniref:3-oxo-Delta(4,5)-steroid 5-beta-reductase n=1 Tax=Selaginella moellendorffii TaxID=88036 RepID=UPI000D1CF2D9|nr:3-oxo-Delta(4,5)-steroid 5-beta-reductase [Selaginella moellendorffii]|eukprot:XP_024521502.1 3-oxo-Delta(4,5)-steroid 5-beta-reductase [Selaginella moellendorffii]
MAEERHLGVAIVIGVTGINGNSICRKLLEQGSWQVYGTGRRDRPDWLPTEVSYVQLDLLDQVDVQTKLSPLKNRITTLFWAAWIPMKTEEENCDANGTIFRNTLDALLPGVLRHICLTTGAKHYLGPFDRWRDVMPAEAPFREDYPRLPVPNFYYVQEDLLFDRVKQHPHLTYSIHRPSAIFGFAPRSYMNCILALVVYAAICKRDKLPFRFFGSRATWEGLTCASDADLIAEQEIWAATHPAAKNQALNITNGDVFKWKHVWAVIADEMGVDPVPFDGESFNLESLMKGRDGAWDALVREHKLLPTKFQDVGQFWFLDTMFERAVENLSNMNKSKELGFLGFRNSEKSVRHWIQVLKAEKIVP